MFFTIEDYKKIQEWLSRNSIKDTEFNEAMQPFKGNEIISFVQNGHNTKAYLKDFVDQLFLLGIPDFVNITEKFDESNISLSRAIQLIPYKSRKIGQVITFLNEEGVWKIYQFKGKRKNQWNEESLWVDIIRDIASKITTLADEEDITTVEENGATVFKFKDKVYNPDNFSGKGRVYLRKNIVTVKDPETGNTYKTNLLTQEMIGKENTIYIIQYDYNLNGQTITIPEGCILQFEGGSFSNGFVIGDLENDFVKPQWFGLFPDKEGQDCTPFLKIACANHWTTYWSKGTWYFSECHIGSCENFKILGDTQVYNDYKTIFSPLKPNQRFILKLGGNNDFSFATSSNNIHEIQARYYSVEGITFNVPDNKKLYNSDTGSNGQSQRYASLVLDYSYSSYFDISFEGVSPALYLRNSWEQKFKTIRICPCKCALTEAAIYCDTSDTSLGSNLSTIMIDTLTCEGIDGILFKSNVLPGFVDIAIDKMSFEDNMTVTNKEYVNIVTSNEELTYALNNIRNENKIPIFDIKGGNISIGQISFNNIGYWKIRDTNISDSYYYRTIFNLYNFSNLEIGSINCAGCPIFYIRLEPYNNGGSGIGLTHIGSIQCTERRMENIAQDIRHLYIEDVSWTYANPVKNRLVINSTNYIINPDIIKMIPIGKGYDALDLLRYCNIKEENNICVLSNSKVLNTFFRNSSYSGIPCLYLGDKAPSNFIFIPKIYVPKFSRITFYLHHSGNDANTGLKIDFYKNDSTSPIESKTSIIRSAPDFINCLSFDINNIDYDYLNIVKVGSGVNTSILIFGMETKFSDFHEFDRAYYRSNYNSGEIYKNPVSGVMQLYDGESWRNIDGTYSNRVVIV